VLPCCLLHRLLAAQELQPGSCCRDSSCSNGVGAGPSHLCLCIAPHLRHQLGWAAQEGGSRGLVAALQVMSAGREGSRWSKGRIEAS